MDAASKGGSDTEIMTLTNWLIDVALVALVLVQLRGRPLTGRGLLLPIALVAFAGYKYLDGIPTAGNDLLLIIAGVTLGAGLGISAGALTRVYRREDGVLMARATVVAAVLWVVGMGGRLIFQIYATHGGGKSIGRFSVTHHLDGTVWATALILSAFAEVFGRTAVLWLRMQTSPARSGVSPMASR